MNIKNKNEIAIEAINELKNKCDSKGYEFVCDEIKPYAELRITNPTKGIVVLLSARNDEYFAGAAIPLSHLPKVLEDWETEKKEWEEFFSSPFDKQLGWYVYESTKYPRNHDLSVWEVMNFLEASYFSSIAI